MAKIPKWREKSASAKLSDAEYVAGIKASIRKVRIKREREATVRIRFVDTEFSVHKLSCEKFDSPEDYLRAESERDA